MPNILLSLESKKSLRNELVSTPEGRLFIAILTHALLDVIEKRDYHTRRTALNWFLVKHNPMRDFCLLLAEIDREYVIRMIKDKVGMTEYEKLYGH